MELFGSDPPPKEFIRVGAAACVGEFEFCELDAREVVAEFFGFEFCKLLEFVVEFCEFEFAGSVCGTCGEILI